jgi:predicted naringenin-chalcone synthase
MYHFYDNEHMMGFKLTNSGLQMILILKFRRPLRPIFRIIHPFWRKNDLTIENIDHLIFHPGGKNRADS